VFGFALTQHRIDILVTIGVIIGALLAGVIVHRLLFWLLARSVGGRATGLRHAILRRARGPMGFILPLVAVLMVLPDANVPEKYSQPIEHLTTVLTYIAIGWGVTAMVGLFADVTLGRYSVTDADNLRARSVETRLFIVSRAISVLVWILAIAAALMTFPAIRTLGATLLASAGLIGIVAGLAARPVFENLVAGLQIAFAQPIRIDDVVVVAGQQGRVEEIRDTFVVVRLVDMRRMILPLTWFIQNPFENWTRSNADLVGYVTVFAPYSFAVADMRDALPAILKETHLWDGSRQAIQVIDATENAIQIRAEVSARNSTDLWDLRCLVRERLVAMIQKKPSA
jgi:small-conductance mechanosensitive channel